jgi:hypothetical protein
MARDECLDQEDDLTTPEQPGTTSSNNQEIP